MKINQDCIQNSCETVSLDAVITWKKHMVDVVLNTKHDHKGTAMYIVNGEGHGTIGGSVTHLIGSWSRPDRLLNKDGSIPDCFIKELLDQLIVEAMLWWDEVHKNATLVFYKNDQKRRPDFLTMKMVDIILKARCLFLLRMASELFKIWWFLMKKNWNWLPSQQKDLPLQD